VFVAEGPGESHVTRYIAIFLSHLTFSFKQQKSNSLVWAEFTLSHSLIDTFLEKCVTLSFGIVNSFVCQTLLYHCFVLYSQGSQLTLTDPSPSSGHCANCSTNGISFDPFITLCDRHYYLYSTHKETEAESG
jgi:hypothetical protein